MHRSTSGMLFYRWKKIFKLTGLLLLWEVSGFDNSSVLFTVLMQKACHQTSSTEVVSVAHCKSPASRCHLAPAACRLVWAISGGSMSGVFPCEDRIRDGALWA